MLTTAALAAALEGLGKGRSSRTVNRWAEKGCPHELSADRRSLRWRLDDVLAWLKTQDGDVDEKREAQIDKERELARKHRMANDRASGMLIPVAEVADRLARLAGSVSESLLSMVPRLNTALGACRTAAERDKVLTDEIHAFLNSFQAAAGETKPPEAGEPANAQG